MSGASKRGAGGLNRREVLAGGLGVAALGAASALTGAGCGGGGGIGLPTASFPQPTVLSSLFGTLNYPLSIVYATNAIETGTPKGVVNFFSRTYNGKLTGSTLRLQAGDSLTVPITNGLPANPMVPPPPDPNTPHNFNSTNLHTHGFHVSPAQDDVYVEVQPNTMHMYSYNLPADHPAGTMWYHPHKHGSTAVQLFSGMTGAIVIEGTAANGDLNSVPEIADATDVIFNINELNLGGLSLAPMLDPYEVPDYAMPSPFAGGDSIFVVNGEFQPTLKVVPGQVVRLRMINSSARNTMPITVQGNDMHLCALDGITIPNMRTVSGVTLAPANRADVLLKIDAPGTYEIRKEMFAPGAGAPTPAAVIAYVEVAGEPFDMPLPAGPLPTPTSLPDILAGEVTSARALVYDVGAGGPMVGGMPAPNFTINGVRFDPLVVNENIPLGSVVEWTISNASPAWHPHHIHIHPFQVISTSDGMLNGLPLLGPTWVDTVNIPPMGSVTVRQRFPDNPGMFVIHCHILVHEDIGMMQNVLVM